MVGSCELEAILAFVASIAPSDMEAVWLTGSRARGDARSDSDWDIVVVTPSMRREPEELFKSNLHRNLEQVGRVEVVFAHPDQMNDPRRYMVDLRKNGIQLWPKDERSIAN